MKNLPTGMYPDIDNQVHYDTEKQKFYMVKWVDTGNSDYAERIYIESPIF
tara:strand:+ start:24243 stop:24392 length:150 start_codon:yes stop_codon:yes gene_type:complete